MIGIKLDFTTSADAGGICRKYTSDSYNSISSVQRVGANVLLADTAGLRRCNSILLPSAQYRLSHRSSIIPISPARLGLLGAIPSSSSAIMARGNMV